MNYCDGVDCLNYLDWLVFELYLNVNYKLTSQHLGELKIAEFVVPLDVGLSGGD